MKPFLRRTVCVCLGAALFSAAAIAQTTNPPPASTVPSDENYHKFLGWNQECEKSVAEMKGKRCDVIFVGDSITRQWQFQGLKVWNQYYKDHHVLNFGVRADRTQNMLWRLDTMDVKEFHPKVAVLMAGTNNTADTPENIAAGVKAGIDKLQQMYPGIKTILVSILPNRRANQKMMDTNALIEKFADNQTVYYLDLVPLFTPVTTQGPDGKEDGNWKGLGKDHLHPEEEGYRMWAEAMNPLLKQLLQENQAAM